MFISYSHHDSGAIDFLQAQMEFRGIQIWRDMDSLLVGRKTEMEISESLGSHAQGVVLWLTKNALKSKFIMNREIMWAKQRAESDPQFDVIPIFAEGEIKQMSRKVYDATGWNLDAYNGIKRNAGETDAALARRAAQRSLQTVVAQIAREKPDEIVMGLQSNFELPPNPRRHLFLKFSALFPGEREWVPNAWDEIRAALEDVRAALSKGIGTRRLFVEARIHLSVAYLLGNVFDLQSRFPLSIDQWGKLWESDGAEDAATTLDIQETPGLIGVRDVTLEMSFTKPIELQVNAFLVTVPFAVARRMQARVHGFEMGKDKLTPAQAHAVISNLHALLLRVRGELNPARVHIFGAVPIGLAMLLGQRTNAVAHTQIYEWDEKKQNFLPTVILT